MINFKKFNLHEIREEIITAFYWTFFIVEASEERNENVIRFHMWIQRRLIPTRGEM